MPSARRDLGHRLADDRLVERGLLGGQRHDHVGLGLGRQLRRDARVGLAAGAAGTAGHQRASRAVASASRYRSTGTATSRRNAVQRAEQPGRRPVEDGPQLRQPVLHRRAGQRDPGRRPATSAAPGRSATAGSSRAVPRRRPPGPTRPRRASRRSWRTTPYVVSTTSSAARSSRCRSAPWYRRTGTPGANRASSRSQVPSSEVGQTTSVGRGRGARRCRCSAMTWIVLPRPMSSARQPPNPSSPLRQPGHASALVGPQRRRKPGGASTDRPAARPRSRSASSASTPSASNVDQLAVDVELVRSARRRAPRRRSACAIVPRRSFATRSGSIRTQRPRSRTSGRFASASAATSAVGQRLAVEGRLPAELQQVGQAEARPVTRAGCRRRLHRGPHREARR